MLVLTNTEKCKRIIKYILMGLVTMSSLRYVPNQLIDTITVLTITV